MTEKYEVRYHWIDNASSNPINSETIPVHATTIQMRKVLTQHVEKRFRVMKHLITCLSTIILK